MTATPSTSERAHRRQGRFGMIVSATLLLLGTFLLVDCNVFVPRQGWNESWGPLVPHDSFPTDCSLCHVSEGWDVIKEDFSFDHEEETGFALNGAHSRAACLRCHNDRGPVDVYVSRGCGGCHADPHQSVLGLDCTRCHGENRWRPEGLIAEHARTSFPLSGSHLSVPCEGCHERGPAGDFRGEPLQCDLCHQDDLARAQNPNHIAAGLTRDCQKCHSATSWGSSGFNHGFFPLIGGHAGLNCNDCHGSGTFFGLSPACFSCHADEYAAAPNHASLGFPTTCQNCHSIITWQGAVFNHQFPLNGPHNVDCTICHQGGNTNTYTCLVCHEHRQTKMDADHSEVGGYSYNSIACYTCHPNGKK
jgi:hypothetical protein